jgi:hypothetical protein
MLKSFSILFIVLASFMGVTQAADKAVVIRSDSNLFPSGEKLDVQTQIILAEQESITVAFATGGIQTVVGPYQGLLFDPLHKEINGEATAKVDLDILAELSTAQTPELTIIRGKSTELATSQNIWLIDVNTNRRNYCIATSSVDLSRPESESKTASILHLSHKKTGQEKTMQWPARQTTLRWPNDLPVVSGDTYTVEITTRQQSSKFKKIELYLVPKELPTDSHKVVWMVGKGCLPQAKMLLASLH